MTDLARRRRARDLWISRSHVAAVGLGVIALGAFCFASGVSVGRAELAATPVRVEAPLPEGELLDLIARVEANAEVEGGLDKLTFPDALAGRSEVPTVPTAETAPILRSTVAPAPGEAIPVDAIPADTPVHEVARFAEGGSALALRDGLRAAGIEAWLGLEIVGGEREHTVVVAKTTSSTD